MNSLIFNHEGHNSIISLRCIYMNLLLFCHAGCNLFPTGANVLGHS